MKIPLKIKISMWYVKRGVILKKTIQLGEIGKEAKLVAFVVNQKPSNICFSNVVMPNFNLWRAVHIVFGISPPQSTIDLFNG